MVKFRRRGEKIVFDKAKIAAQAAARGEHTFASIYAQSNAQA